jgi:hypothetical protein
MLYMRGECPTAEATMADAKIHDTRPKLRTKALSYHSKKGRKWNLPKRRDHASKAGRQRCQLHVRRNNAWRNVRRRRYNDPSIRRYERQTNTERDERPRRSRGKRCSVKGLRRSGSQGRHSSLRKMRRKKEKNLNSDPSSKTRACTNDDENVTARQETREETVGNGELRRQGRRKGHSWQSTNENKERGNSGDSDVEDEDAGFEVRQLPVRKHEVEETNLE